MQPGYLTCLEPGVVMIYVHTKVDADSENINENQKKCAGVAIASELAAADAVAVLSKKREKLDAREIKKNNTIKNFIVLFKYYYFIKER
jgi:hypothetical protein